MFQYDDESPDATNESEILLMTGSNANNSTRIVDGKRQLDQENSATYIKDKHRVVNIIFGIACVILAVITVTVLVRCTRKTSTNKSKRESYDKLKLFFHMSDTHLDLYYDKDVINFQGEDGKMKEQFCRNVTRKDSKSIKNATTEALFGRVGCDSPVRLLQSAAVKLKSIAVESSHPIEFVLLTGDQTAHDYKEFNVSLQDSVYSSIEKSTSIIADALKIPVVPLIESCRLPFVCLTGNNDIFNDYVPPTKPGDPFFENLRKILEPYIYPGENIGSVKDDFRSTFDIGGYYLYKTQGDMLYLVMLNTNFWSIKGYKFVPAVTVIGDMQMQWLNTTLQNAKRDNKKVIIAGHIPPGCDSYDDETFWLANYTEIFVKFTTLTYRDTVSAQLFGHTHSDQWKVLSSFSSSRPYEGSYLLICPGITPNYKNNPAFRLMKYDEDAEMMFDYTQYFLDLSVANVIGNATWLKEYSFKDLYKADLTFNSLNNLIDGFLDASASTWYNYREHMRTMFGSVLNSKRYIQYCAAKYFDNASYMKCIKKYKNVGL